MCDGTQLGPGGACRRHSSHPPLLPIGTRLWEGGDGAGLGVAKGIWSGDGAWTGDGGDLEHAYPSAIAAIPPVIATAAARRTRPERSRRTTAAKAVAISTLLSRTAETGAAGACVSAARASA